MGGKHEENAFQRARVSAGLSQEKAAEALDCGTRSLQRYESGRNEPPISVLLRMRQLYQCEISEFYPLLKEQEESPPSYRVPIRVSAVRTYQDSLFGTTCFPVCPRCRVSLEREYQRYCDRCGQALNWSMYSQARLDCFV